jgi:pSer/pThr/pTyr-binding forkhead associated (FHA) protein
VIRIGGGRAGEQFPIGGDRMAIGRAPSADVFLDDITVSREHAVLDRRDDGLHLSDAGSLNGTYVNRQRIESVRLADGDEVQIGKYRLTYIERGA